MTLARIYPSTSAAFMNRFEDATYYPYGYIILNIKSSTSEQDKLQNNIFDSTHQHALNEENVSDSDDANTVESLNCIRDLSPLG